MILLILCFIIQLLSFFLIRLRSDRSLKLVFELIKNARARDAIAIYIISHK